MNTLSLDEFTRWMDAYGKLCVERDTQVFHDLFALDAVYYETPYSEPLRGYNAVYRYFFDTSSNVSDIQFSYEILSVSGRRGMSLWQGGFIEDKSGNQVILDGVFLVEFDDQHKCCLFREWWHRKEFSPEPT